MQKLVEQHWDYTKHAKFYEFRPNYADVTIDMLISLVRGHAHAAGGGAILPRSRYWSWHRKS